MQDHQVGGHLPGHSDPVPDQLLIHVEQDVVRIPDSGKKQCVKKVGKGKGVK